MAERADASLDIGPSEELIHSAKDILRKLWDSEGETGRSLGMLRRTLDWSLMAISLLMMHDLSWKQTNPYIILYGQCHLS
jgi:hypothetical protein